MYNLTVTDSAKVKIKELMSNVPEDIEAVRIFVSGVSSSGKFEGISS